MVRKQAGQADCFGFSGRIRYHDVGGPEVVASAPAFASSALCDELVSLCDEMGFRQDDTVREYEQTTTDIEVDSTPLVRQFLLTRRLVSAVGRVMRLTHGVQPCAFDDVFVVRYAAEEQRALPRHTDAGDVSFMLALSRRTDYAGGGTWFEGEVQKKENIENANTDLEQETVKHQIASSLPQTTPPASNSVLHLSQGELVLFGASMLHAGLPITHGKRYLLVGFCHVQTRALRASGNVGMDLRQITGTRSPFGVWRWRLQTLSAMKQKVRAATRPTATKARCSKQRSQLEVWRSVDTSTLRSAAQLLWARQLHSTSVSSCAASLSPCCSWWTYCDDVQTGSMMRPTTKFSHHCPVLQRGQMRGTYKHDVDVPEHQSVDAATCLLAEFSRNVYLFHTQRLNLACGPEGGAEFWIKCRTQEHHKHAATRSAASDPARFPICSGERLTPAPVCTVSYLTHSQQDPTVVLFPQNTGEAAGESATRRVEAFVSYSVPSKHIAFAGGVGFLSHLSDEWNRDVPPEKKRKTCVRPVHVGEPRLNRASYGPKPHRVNESDIHVTGHAAHCDSEELSLVINLWPTGRPSRHNEQETHQVTQLDKGPSGGCQTTTPPRAPVTSVTAASPLTKLRLQMDPQAWHEAAAHLTSERLRALAEDSPKQDTFLFVNSQLGHPG